MNYSTRSILLNEINSTQKLLDPTSRYITELLDLVNSATSEEELKERLISSFRVNSYVDDEVLKKLSLIQITRLHLVTPETYWMRFSAEEEISLKKVIKDLPLGSTILSSPCSTGLEVLSLCQLAIEDQKLKELSVIGVDLNPELSTLIQSGKIPSRIPNSKNHDTVCNPQDHHLVDPEIMKVISFRFGDLLGTEQIINRLSDLVLCRNFIGFFKPHYQRVILDNLRQISKSGTYLMIDDFALRSPKCAEAVSYLNQLGYEPTDLSATIFRLK